MASEEGAVEAGEKVLPAHSCDRHGKTLHRPVDLGHRAFAGVDDFLQSRDFGVLAQLYKPGQCCVRASIAASAASAGKSAADREFAIQQILDRAVVSTEIVDILAAAGITTPDISILSDEFLAEVQQLEKKNLALEALRKLLNDEIRSRSKANVVETKRFSERLEAAIARYHTNAISTVEVLQELIDLAKEVRAARRRGQDEGLSQDEIAFYDALAENESAVELMGNDSLKVIAHELLVSLKGSVSVDWSHRESARARMRVLVKRILRKHGFPPDLQDAAVQTVLRQAEALSSQWAA